MITGFVAVFAFHKCQTRDFILEDTDSFVKPFYKTFIIKLVPFYKMGRYL